MAQVKSELLASGQFDEDKISQGGLRITSTIVKDYQDQAVEAAESMNQVRGWDPKYQHVALSSMDPATGEIFAEYAGPDFEERQQNAVTQDIAMAGSSFKPFALLANARLGGSVYDIIWVSHRSTSRPGYGRRERWWLFLRQRDAGACNRVFDEHGLRGTQRRRGA